MNKVNLNVIVDHNISLPVQLCTNNSEFDKNVNFRHEKVAVILGHGLGSVDPRSKDHLKDKMLQIMISNSSEWSAIDSVILYTARGHGNSLGWESSAASDEQQFSWHRLANDMIGVGDFFGYKDLIVGGSSMGAATALFSAILYPDRIRGVILARPPTAWEERLERKQILLQNAQKLFEAESLEGGLPLFYHVLHGAASADFPPLDSDLYRRVQCPVLILALRDDPAHPETTALNLAQKIDEADLHFANNYEEASRDWPLVIASFISKLMKK